MSFMKGNVNIVLLTLVIISMVGLVAITVIYENRFTQLSEDYTTKIDDLNYTMEKLDLQMTKYNETRYELELKAEREAELGGKYTEIKGEKEQLTTDLEKTTADLGEMKTNYIAAKSDLIRTQNDLISTQAALNAASDKITRYKNIIATLDASVKKIRGHVNPYVNDDTDACYNFAVSVDEDLDDAEQMVSGLKSI